MPRVWKDKATGPLQKAARFTQAAKNKATDIKESTSRISKASSRIVRGSPRAAMVWGNQQIPRGYGSLSRAVKASKVISQNAGDDILRRVASAWEASAETGYSTLNMASVTANAILASDFSTHMDRWLRATFTEGPATVYDKAMDTRYSEIHIGGSHHRLFDDSHTLWGAWDKVSEALPNDTFAQEVAGLAAGLWKDLLTPMGIPVVGWDKASYDQISESLNSTLHIPKQWFFDLWNVNGSEIFGVSVATIAVVMNWKKRDTEQFSRLVGSLGISAVIAANPALGVLALASLAKAYGDARKQGDYRSFLDGLAKGGVGTGVFLATAAAIGGPVPVGILAGMCTSIVVRQSLSKIEIPEITSFIGDATKRAMASHS
ncbi:hypothetical protein FIM08_03510 [SAR202 cluster bacterium AC-647-N09_OGT_505m]|nr:hypothetical protein [SAR202 cluster bacterium AC-647-N09_OGT_505m]